MFKELKQHSFAYTILFLGLGITAWLFLSVWPDRVSLRIISGCLVLFYILWGVITHLHHDRISRNVVVEYIAVGSLSGLLLILLTM